MKKTFRIPTVIGLISVIGLIAVCSIIFNSLFEKPTQADKSIEPKNTQFTNLTDTTFTVSWLTDSEATGTIILSGQSKTQTVFDERDTSGSLGKYQTHSITARDLKPNTQYRVKILSNGKTYTDNGNEYQISTLSPLDALTKTLEPAYGTILTADNKAATGALVYLSISGSQLLSTIVQDSGSWLIPLNQIRTQDYLSYIKPSDRIEEYLTVRHPSDEASAVTDTLNDSPVPVMIIGKTYDFRKQQAKITPVKSLADLSTSQKNPDEGKVLGTQTNTTNQKKISVDITQPVDKATLVTNLPIFQGTAPIGRTVSIRIGIKNPTSATTSADMDGIWRYTPDKPLTVGKNSVTVSASNSANKVINVTHSFEILKSGTQVLGDATPSATLTPTPEDSPTPVSTLAGQPIPETGSVLPTVLLILLGLSLIASGGIIYLK